MIVSQDSPQQHEKHTSAHPHECHIRGSCITETPVTSPNFRLADYGEFGVIPCRHAPSKNTHRHKASSS